MNLINKKFGDKEIIFDYSQNGVVYLNATKTAKQFGKEAKRWLALKETQEYIKLLELKKPKDILNGFDGFVVTRRGGKPETRGIWLHPKLTVFFARWLNMEFSIWCDDVIEEILKKGFAVLPEAKKSPSKDLIDVASQIMQTRKATVEKRHQLLSMIESFLDFQTELEIGASFQGKARNEIDTLVDNYRSGKIVYSKMVEELQRLKIGKSFKV